MKKQTLLLIFSFFTILFINGKNIDVLTAEKVAKTFFEKNVEYVDVKLTLAFECKGTHLISQEDITLYYVFNVLNKPGYIIVSGDDSAKPILGYSKSGFFEQEKLPINYRKWMEGYKKQLNYIIQNNIPQTKELFEEWSLLQNGLPNPQARNNSSVDPLLTTQWNQGSIYENEGYNQLCPPNSVTGCTATAMAQIMNYWEHPIQGTGFHSYNENNYGTLSANFGATTYDWNSMPNYSANNAVATLMYHCGVSVEMNYTPFSGSSAAILSFDLTWLDNLLGNSQNPSAENALKTFFKYKESIDGIMKSEFSTTEWINVFKQELNNNRPILHAGYGINQGEPSGHAFVCDGYDNNDLFHFNWGWGGQDDGYFWITNLSTSNGDYSNSQQAVIGIEPIPPPTYDLQLYSELGLSNNTIYYGQQFTVNTNVVNYGEASWGGGDFTAVIFDASNNFVDYVEVLENYGELPVQNYFINGLTFESSDELNLLPGIYYIAIYSKIPGEGWEFVSNGNYSNWATLNVISPNNIELYSSINTNPNNFTTGEPGSVVCSIANNSDEPFLGEFRASLWNLDGSFSEIISILPTDEDGLASGYGYPDITFNTSSITSEPGTYLLEIAHSSNDENSWYFTGSTAEYQNPIFVTIVAPPVEEDIYEANNTENTAYEFSTNFINNSCTILTTGATIHSETDHDYYSIVLEEGFDYTIIARAHDSYNSGNGEAYSVDVDWRYWSNDDWSDVYDDEMLGDINIINGGLLGFEITSYFGSATGTYLFEIEISRTPNISVSESSIQETISVFPNPSSDYLNVIYNGSDVITHVSIVDINGKVIRDLDGFANQNNTIVSIKNLSKGVYFLTFFSDKEIWKKEFIKTE